jgi:benzoyl-CoA reductase/2-hydroxyglutaryl-CoA dehydratase subunit BcrC/BadD/HgdB
MIEAAILQDAFQLSYADVAKSSEQRLRELSMSGRATLGYVYPHIPLELFLAHGITPSLAWADPSVQGGFEGSLQTFACSLARNLFSQRSMGGLSSFSGILFPCNTCDSLLNVADVWRHRFSEDKLFRLTYPAARFEEDSVSFLAEELRILSESLKEAFGRPFSEDELAAAVALVNRFRESAQILYACRIVNSSTVSYFEVARMVREFLTAPNADTVEPISELAGAVLKKLEQGGQLGTVKLLKEELLSGTLSDTKIAVESTIPRIMVVGGMTEPLAIASLFRGSGKFNDGVVVLDLLSYGFKTVFTPPVNLEGDPFVAMSRSILNAPSEPTQEGLPRRLEFIKLLLSKLSINGLVVCEQSFCDPDQFEAPSVLKVASEAGVPSVRLPIDPELSDRARLKGRIQSFLETFGGGPR